MRAVELFQINYAGEDYLLTSAATAQEHNGETYEPAPIGRGGTQVKSELSKSNLDVRIGLGHALADAVLSNWSETQASLTIFRVRTSGTETVWKGRLASVKPDAAAVVMTFESIYTSLRRPGLRARFQKPCRHPLYGRGCFLNPEDFAVAATLSAISGRVLTVPAASGQADGWYSGGMVRAPDGSLSYVSAHTGSSLTLNRVSTGLLSAFASEGAGTAITLYPGCPHTYAACRDKFDNDDNFGGFLYIPTKNPMGGSSIV